MRNQIYVLLICFAMCSCSKRPDTENVSRVEPINLSAEAYKSILYAIHEYDKTTNVQIVLSEDWGKTEGRTEYKIKVDDPADSEEPRSYWLINQDGIWKVTSREL